MTEREVLDLVYDIGEVYLRKMKKLITTVILTALAVLCARADFVSGNGFVTVTGNTDLTLTITRDFGGNKSFGYYKYDPATGQRGELIAIDASQGGTFTITGLNTGDVISFYTKHAGQGIIYGDDFSKKDGYNLSSMGFDAENGYESFNLKLTGNNNGVQFRLSIPAPAGQPMPGVIATTAVGAIAAGALLMRRRKRRKAA